MRDHDGASRELLRLVEIVATLRSPGGCPWDREQTIDTLKPFVLEETYEVLQAIDTHDHQALCEELGDFIFEAVFLSQLEQEAGHFSIGDALAAVADKLVRRHPHVFARGDGEPPLASAGAVVERWEEIKARERSAQAKPSTLLSGIPDALPSLVRADRIGRRAASVGFDWNRAADVIGKIQEEVDEVREVVAGEGPLKPARLEEEVGDLLFAIASLSRKLGVEPETALRKANTKFTRRFTAMEATVANSGRHMRQMTIEELEDEWQRIKIDE